MARPASVDPASLTFAPLTPTRWDDVVELFGAERGGHGGCWCQWFRLLRPEYESLGREGRKARFANVVETGPAPGILAYLDGRPVGWCAVSPRDAQPRLDKGRASRRLGDIDYDAVWVITCLFVDPAWRRRGLMRPLIARAVDLARSQGARHVEAYPMVPTVRTGNADLYVGQLDAFLSNGFCRLSNPLPQRVVVRRAL